MDRLTAMYAFARVVDAGSFSAAARRWGRSKAAVSKYVADLEAHLGVTLLRRNTRSLTLTEAGAAYYPRCIEILNAVDATETGLREQQSALRGTLRVTAPPGFASRYLAVLTCDFVARHPQVRIDLDLTHRMIDLVEEAVDVAVRMTEPQDSSLIARRLAPAPCIAVAAPRYLAARGQPETPRELRGHDCLVDTNFRDQQRWRFRVGGRTQRVTVDGPFRVNSPLAVRDLAIAGHGIAIVPALIAEAAIATGELVEVLPGTVALRWSIYAVYPRREHLPERVRAYVDHLAEALAVRA